MGANQKRVLGILANLFDLATSTVWYPTLAGDLPSTQLRWNLLHKQRKKRSHHQAEETLIGKVLVFTMLTLAMELLLTKIRSVKETTVELTHTSLKS